LWLLPTKEDSDKLGAKAFLIGAPDSVAVIEAGLTAGSKWWSAGIGVSSAAITVAFTRAWTAIPDESKPFALLALGLVLAAATIGIAYILGSDVRGRASASTATIEARRDVASAMLDQAGKAHKPAVVPPAGGALAAAPPAGGPSYFHLPMIENVTLLDGPDTDGWRVIAGRQVDKKVEYLLVRGENTRWAASRVVRFRG
jgi:hypothetical protein